MCNPLHISMGPLSVLPSPRGIPSMFCEIRPGGPSRMLAPIQRKAPAGTVDAAKRTKYTTSRECRPRDHAPIHTFGDLARFVTAKADLAYRNYCRLSSPGWNGGNLPTQAEALWPRVKSFAKHAKTGSRTRCEARRPTFEAQHTCRLAGTTVRRSLACDHRVRSRQLNRRSHVGNTDSNSNRIADTITHAHTYADANAERAFGLADMVGQLVVGGGELQHLSRINSFRSVCEAGQRRHHKFYGYDRTSGKHIFLCSYRSQQFQR